VIAAVELCHGATVALGLVAVLAIGVMAACVVVRFVDPEVLADHARHAVNRLLVVRSAFRSRRLHPGAYECSPACEDGHTYTWPCEQAAR
jgi:hypothetical protein